MIEEYKLEDDYHSEFKGGSLKINTKSDSLSRASPRASLDKPDSIDKKDNASKANANCQWSNAFISPLAALPNRITETLWSKKPEVSTTSSTSSATSEPKIVPPKSPKDALQPVVNVPEDPNDFFTFRDGVIENAVKECKEQFLDEETEGALVGYFLLTHINHWDTDKERLVLLTTKILVIAKYDFIALRRLGCKKIPVERIEQLYIGDLVYPNASLIPERNMRGLRIYWRQDKPCNFGAKWNPFNDDVPFSTFTFHPLYFHKDCVNDNRRQIYNLDQFVDKLCNTITDHQGNMENKTACLIFNKNILLENYIGIGSLIHNRNSLGFFKVRGKFSF